MVSVKIILAVAVLSCLMSGSPPTDDPPMSVYLLRLDGAEIPAETYVGALNEPGFGGGLGFWGVHGRSQAIEAAKTMRRKGWPCSVLEISGPAKIIYQEAK